MNNRLNSDGWKILLKNLWTITELSQEINDIWIEIITPILPNSLNPIYDYNDLFGDVIHLENGKMVLSEEPHILKAEFDLLKMAYAESNEEINNFIDEVYEVGSSYMNVGVTNDGPFSFPSLKNVIQFMESNRIMLPDITLFSQYSFNPGQKSNYGWGLPFDGKKLSKILKD
mgnify:CR=1 FL=1